MVLDVCPQEKSCGSLKPMWTDQRMPKAIHVPTTVDLHISYNGNCFWKTLSNKLEVIRCSWDTSSDIIYRIVGSHDSVCSSTVCGMN